MRTFLMLLIASALLNYGVLEPVIDFTFFLVLPPVKRAEPSE